MPALLCKIKGYRAEIIILFFQDISTPAIEETISFFKGLLKVRIRTENLNYKGVEWSIDYRKLISLDELKWVSRVMKHIKSLCQ